jgi:outer membrane immunogenic protein
MRTKIVSLLAAAFSLGVLQAASAADMPTKAPFVKAPVDVQYNWTGAYVGINGGGGWGRESWLDNAIGAPGFRPTGGVFGGQLGYRLQWNQFVFGIEGTLDWAGLTDNLAGGIFTEQFKVKSLYTVTGQVGWAMDRWLPYVKGGWAGGTTNASLGGFVTASNSETNNGWTVGGGIDYAVWQNWIIGVEYDHFSLNYGAFTAPVSNGGVPWISTNTSRLTIDQVVARVSYKFWTP